MKSMSNIPIDGYNTYYTSDGFNTIMLDVINPLGVLANYQVTINYPLFPSYSEDIPDEPTFELSHFLVWARPLKEFLSETDSSLYPLYVNLVTLAKKRVRWTLIQDTDMWRQLVSLYVAHYMQEFILAMKDEANRMSLNPYEKDKDYHYEMVLANTVYDEFKTTMYGRLFWHIGKPFFQFEIWGTL